MSCQENICWETWLTIKCEKLPDGCREQNSNDSRARAETLNKDFKLFITGREGREGDILTGKNKLLPEGGIERKIQGNFHNGSPPISLHF